MGEAKAPDCPRCEDVGFYFDPRCIVDTCAHGGRTFSPLELKRRRKVENKRAEEEKRKPVLIPNRLPRVMDCPARACPCSAGDGIRRALKSRARRNHLAYEEAEAKAPNTREGRWT